jgi:type VI secretion system secreted protein VgrG
VSLRAHTDTLQLLADQAITVLSVNGEIHLSASSKIELIGADSSIVLDGADITFTTPGTWTAKGSAHAFLGGGSVAAELPALPAFHPPGQEPCQAEYVLYQTDARSFDGYAYELRLADGTLLTQGTTSAEGRTQPLVTEQPTMIYAYKAVMPLSERITEDWSSALDQAAAAAPTT